MFFCGPRRPANKNSPGFLLVALRYSSTAWRVCSVNSNRTGRPVFFWRTVARSAVYPPAATSSTLIATTSRPRSLLLALIPRRLLADRRDSILLILHVTLLG